MVLTEKLAKLFDDRAKIFYEDDTPVDPDSRRADFQAATAANAASPNDWRTHVLQLEAWPEEIYDRPLVAPGLGNPGETPEQWDGEGGGLSGEPAMNAPFDGAEDDADLNPLSDFKAWSNKHGAPPRPGLVFDESSHRWVRPEDLQGGKGKKPGAEPSKKPRVQQKLSERAQRAQASATRVDATIQRYAEEHNEPRFAKAVGGLSFKDNEPVDVVLGDGGVIKHGIELKTMVTNKANKITMKRSAMERKAEWEKANKATFHTVVIDDSNVFNAKGEGQHDETKRRIFYRRGFGSFRVNTMHEVKNIAELKKLLDTPNDKLPPAAQSKAKAK